MFLGYKKKRVTPQWFFIFFVVILVSSPNLILHTLILAKMNFCQQMQLASFTFDFFKKYVTCTNLVFKYPAIVYFYFSLRVTIWNIYLNTRTKGKNLFIFEIIKSKVSEIITCSKYIKSTISIQVSNIKKFNNKKRVKLFFSLKIKIVILT